VIALLGTGSVYWLRIYPQVGRELAIWKVRAETIPDPVLRGQALHKLTDERLNPEAAAFFAVLAPRRARRRVVRLIVAYQLLYDYLDAVNELPGCTALKNGLQLHLALIDAVQPDQPLHDFYLHNTRNRDGGYANALASTCRSILRSLASAVRLRSLLADAAERCGQAQSHNHAISSEGDAGLVNWCSQQAIGSDYLWWELAAGGISCLAIHALFALAADPQSTTHAATLLDAAYFPPICAISALLDSLADHHSDACTNNHSFTARYRNSAHAADRLVVIAAAAAERVRRLHHHRRHSIILCGIVAFYLSSPTVQVGFPAPVAESLTSAIGPLAPLMIAAMRLRRQAHTRALSNSQPPEYSAA
jgi:tetraprenyl-beta-curcumene synthase